MISVGIVGGTGYTAVELLKILLRHPQTKITAITSRDDSRPHLGAVHPELHDRLDLRFERLDIERLASQVDVVFCCLPHAASAEIVGGLLDAGVKVIDLSADYRLNDVATFEQWYGVKHPDADRVGQVPYGIPEFFRERISQSNLVANPGCFPSSALIPLLPLLKAGLIETSPIIVDSKTGISGAGRKANLKFHYPECNESISAYGIGNHRHMPEIDQIAHRFCGAEIQSVFTPHLTPMDRGILSTIYVRPSRQVAADDSAHAVHACWNEFYKNEPFIRVKNGGVATKHVSGTNFCDISVADCRGTLVITSALDNLIKGASGAAVQNLNAMYGLDESMGIL